MEITGVQFDILAAGRSRSRALQRMRTCRSVARNLDPDLKFVVWSARSVITPLLPVFEADRHVPDLAAPSAFVATEILPLSVPETHVPERTSNCKRPPEEIRPRSALALFIDDQWPFSHRHRGRQQHCHHRRPEHEDTPPGGRYASSRFADESCHNVVAAWYPLPSVFGIIGLPRKSLPKS
jgi:hypothetical protein